jgi:uncharacterized protein DUF1236
MQKILLVAAALAFGAAAGLAQTVSPPGSTPKDSLSIDQQRKMGEIITNEAKPLTDTNFTLAIDSTVPGNIELRPLPTSAGELAPQFRAYNYVAIDEQIALVDPRSRKIVTVIPRWRRQDMGTERGAMGSGDGNAR